MKENKRVKVRRDDLIKAVEIFEAKQTPIFQEVKALAKRPAVDSKEIELLVRRLEKLIEDFGGKLRALKK